MLWGGKMNRTIIINKMYAGKYLETGENIGHEIINLFQTDTNIKHPNNKHYIYLNSIGTIDMDYVNDAEIIYTEGKEKDARQVNRRIDVLLVRPINSHVFQILAKAENVKVLDSAIKSDAEYYTEHFDTMEKRRKAQEKLEIKYNKVEISKILEKNFYNERTKQDIFATFVTDRLYKPQTSLFICSQTDNESETEIAQYKIMDGEYINIPTEKGFGRQSLRLFFTKDINENTKAESKEFEKLVNIIDNNKRYWDEEYKFSQVTDDILNEKVDNINFLSIIKEDDRDLTFSNLLQYFLSNKTILKSFCKNFNIDIQIDNANISVNREEHDIDLIIRDGKNIIIIENKILSGINGTDKTIENQLKKVCEIKNEKKSKSTKNKKKQIDNSQKIQNQKLYKELKNEVDNEPKDAIVSQLSKYYFYARKIAKEENINIKNVKMYLLCPEYQKNFYKPDNLKKYLYGKKYTTITYKDLYNFFGELDCDKDFYFNEFLKAIEKHSKEFNNSKEEEMKHRFIKAIKKVNNEQNS